MEELKPCPYCGGKMKISHSQLFTSEGVLDGFYGSCTVCYSRLAPEETRQKAVIACNKRSEPAINDFMDGVKYAIYEIMKEADIPGSQEIRDSGDTDDGMCAKVAERIRAELAAAPENHAVAIEQDTPVTIIPEKLKNEPLTLEQLRKMDGEPIYVQTGEGKEGYVIITWDCGSPLLYGPDWDESPTGDFDTDFYNLRFNDPSGHFGLHVLGWVAYLLKPEGPAS